MCNTMKSELSANLRRCYVKLEMNVDVELVTERYGRTNQ